MTARHGDTLLTSLVNVQKILENMHARTSRYTQPTFKTQLRRVPALTQIMIFHNFLLPRQLCVLFY